MYAIVDIAGQQIKVEKDQKIFVHRLEGAEGSKVSFDKILLLENDGDIKVGTPVVENYIVSASIIAHIKGDKVLVFKKKRRKGYQKMNGHRQQLTQLLIEGIGEGKIAPKKAAEKPAADTAVKTEAKTAAETKATDAGIKETKTTKAKAAGTEVKETKTKKKAEVTKTETTPKTAKKTPAAKKTAPKKAAAPKAKKEDTAPKKPTKAAPKTKSKE